MVIVVDASLAVKWYIDEPLSDEAEDLLRATSGNIIVPDIFVAEVAGALVRRANIDKSMRPASEMSIARFSSLFSAELIVIERLEPVQVEQAAQIAFGIGHPLKDCLYLMLAMKIGCPLVTCDAKFASKARRVYPDVRVLGTAAD